MGRSRSLNKLFAEAEGSPLGSVVAKTAQLKTLKGQILSHLPPQLGPQVEIAEDSRGTLTLFCPSGAVANRLRFMETQLLERMNSDPQLPKLHRIRAVVHGSEGTTVKIEPEKSSGKSRFAISSNTASLIEKTGAAVSNPDLEAALKKLARNSQLQNNQAAE